MNIASVLVVCTGNICRSPVGERLLQHALPHLTVTSAGTAAVVGHAADTGLAALAAADGVSLTGHAARQLTPALLRSHDLILAMEPRHIDAMTVMMPEARGRMMLFSRWTGNEAIPDPWRRSEEVSRHVYALLGQAAREWARRLGRP